MRITKVTLTIRPGMSEFYEETFHRLRKQVLANEEGCTFFELCRDQNTPNKYYVFEAYVDEAAVELHIQTPIYKETARIFVECIEGDHMSEIKARGLDGREMYNVVKGIIFERFETVQKP